MNNKETRYTIVHYLFGALPARLGDEMSGQAILLMGIATGSAALGSTLLGCLTFAAGVGGPFLGAILDRSAHPGRILASALGLYSVGIALTALLLGHVTVWLCCGIALVSGLCMPAISGGWSSRLKSFIADEHIARASAIDAMTFNIAGLVGPALAGLIAAWFGAGWTIIVLVSLLITALPMAWSLPRHSNHMTSYTTSFLQDIVAGFRVIIFNRLLLRITLASVISYFGIGMLWVVCPLIGQEMLGNPGYGGVLMSVLSVAGLVATILYAKWPPRCSPDTVAFVTTLILALAMALLALAGNILVALVAMLIAGLADGPQLAAIFAVRHREAPEQSRSQVFTTAASLKITAAAIGSVLAGYLASRSLSFTIIVICIVQLIAAISFIMLSRRRS